MGYLEMLESIPKPLKPVAGRLMLWCEECGARNGDRGWRCPQHPRKTVVQGNRPYLGKPVPQEEVEGLKVVDAGALVARALKK